MVEYQIGSLVRVTIHGENEVGMVMRVVSRWGSDVMYIVLVGEVEFWMMHENLELIVES